MSKTAYKGRHRRSRRDRRSRQHNRRNRNNTHRRISRSGGRSKSGRDSQEREIARLQRKLQPATKRSPLRFLREMGYLGEGRKIAAENKKKTRETILRDLQEHVEIKKGVGKISDAVERIRRGDYSGIKDANAGITQIEGPINHKYSATEAKLNRQKSIMDEKTGAVIEAFDSISDPGVSDDEVNRYISQLQVDALPAAGKKLVNRKYK